MQIKDPTRSTYPSTQRGWGGHLARAAQRRMPRSLIRPLLAGCAFITAAATAHPVAGATAWTYRCAAYGYTIAVPAAWYRSVRSRSDCRADTSGIMYSTYGVAPSSPNFHTADRQAEFEVVVDPAGRASLARWTQSLLTDVQVRTTARVSLRMGSLVTEGLRSTVVLHTAQGGAQQVVILSVGTQRAGRFYGVEAFVTQDDNPAAAAQEAAITGAVGSMSLP